jgi:hypothetical protein
MVIRFPSRQKPRPPKEVRLESHPSGLNRTGARRLSKQEIVHRERMLQYLQRSELRRSS